MLKNRIVTFSVFTQPGPVSFQSFRITSTVSNATQDHDITNCIMQYRAILCTFDEAYRPRMGAIFLQSTLTKVSGSRSGASIGLKLIEIDKRMAAARDRQHIRRNTASLRRPWLLKSFLLKSDRSKPSPRRAQGLLVSFFPPIEMNASCKLCIWKAKANIL